MTNTAACPIGALCANAAPLGLHWIYDPDLQAAAAVATAKGDLGKQRTQAYNSSQSSTDYAKTRTFTEAVEANIHTDGDSAGRAMLIGAAHGIGGASGIPAAYLVKLHNADPLWQHCQAPARLPKPAK